MEAWSHHQARQDVERLLAAAWRCSSIFARRWPWLLSLSVSWVVHMVPLMQSAWVWVAVMIVFLSLPSSLLCTRASTLICNYLYSLCTQTRCTESHFPWWCSPNVLFLSQDVFRLLLCVAMENLRLFRVWWWAARDGFSFSSPDLFFSNFVNIPRSHPHPLCYMGWCRLATWKKRLDFHKGLFEAKVMC